MSEAAPRPYLVGLALGGLVSFLLLFWILTFSTWHLGMKEEVRDKRMDYLTVEARQIMKGEFAVPKLLLGSECIYTEDRCYGYFGITPSLLRIPVLLLTAKHIPDLAQGYFAAGCAVMLLGIGLLFVEARRWVPGRTGRVREALLGAGGMLAVGASSPSLILATQPFVFEEVIIWAVAFACLGGWTALVWYRTGDWRLLAATALFATLSILSRPNTALACLAVLLFLVLLRHGRQPRLFALCAAVCLLPVVAYASVNYAKFQTVGVPLERHYDFGPENPVRHARIGNFAGLSLSHVPTQLWYYLRPDGLWLSDDFPYVDYNLHFRIHALWPAHNIDFEGQTFSSLTATNPLAFLALVVAALVAWRAHRQRRAVTLGALLSVLFLAPLAVSASFFSFAERYKGDVLPFLAWTAAWAIPIAFFHVRYRKLLAAAAVLVVAWQVYVGIALVLIKDPQSGGNPPGIATERVEPFRLLLDDPSLAKLRDVIWRPAPEKSDVHLAAAYVQWPVGTVLAQEAVAKQPLLVAGWAVDRGTKYGAGVDKVYAWMYPADGEGRRVPDSSTVWAGGGPVAVPTGPVSLYGPAVVNAGYSFFIDKVPPGRYLLVLSAHSYITGQWIESNQPLLLGEEDPEILKALYGTGG